METIRFTKVVNCTCQKTRNANLRGLVVARLCHAFFTRRYDSLPAFAVISIFFHFFSLFFFLIFNFKRKKNIYIQNIQRENRVNIKVKNTRKDRQNENQHEHARDITIIR